MKNLNEYFTYQAPEVVSSPETAKIITEILNKAILENDNKTQNDCKDILDLIKFKNKA